MDDEKKEVGQLEKVKKEIVEDIEQELKDEVEEKEENLEYKGGSKKETHNKKFDNKFIDFIVLIFAILNDALDIFGIGSIPIVMDVYDILLATIESKFNFKKGLLIAIAELIPGVEFLPIHTFVTVKSLLKMQHKIKEKHEKVGFAGFVTILSGAITYYLFGNLLLTAIVAILALLIIYVQEKKKVNIGVVAVFITLMFIFYIYQPFITNFYVGGGAKVAQQESKFVLSDIFTSITNFFTKTRAQNEAAAAGTNYKRAVNYYSKANIKIEYKDIFSSLGPEGISTYYKEDDIPITYSAVLEVGEFGFKKEVEARPYCLVKDSSNKILKKIEVAPQVLDTYNKGFSYTCHVGEPKDFNIGIYSIEFHTLFDYETWAYVEVPFITEDYFLTLEKSYSGIESIENKYVTTTIYTYSPISVGIGVPGKSNGPLTQVIRVKDNNEISNPMNYVGVDLSLNINDRDSIQNIKRFLLFVPQPFEIVESSGVYSNKKRCGAYPYKELNKNSISDLLSRVDGLQDLIDSENMKIYEIDIPNRAFKDQWRFHLVCNLGLRSGTTIEDFFPDPLIQDTAKTFLTYIDFDYDVKEKRYFKIKENVATSSEPI